MHNQRRATSAFLVVFFVLAFLPAALRADTLSDQLGKVNFPSSCSRELQPTIEKGVALLHSFQYTESEKTFAQAAEREPKCAIAYWGKAMALVHQLWDFPDDKTLKEGRKDIEKAHKLHSASPREESFIEAAAAFFGKKSRMTHAERTEAYSRALEKSHTAYPGDVEFSAFYALSLV